MTERIDIPFKRDPDGSIPLHPLQGWYIVETPPESDLPLAVLLQRSDPRDPQGETSFQFGLSLDDAIALQRTLFASIAQLEDGGGTGRPSQ